MVDGSDPAASSIANGTGLLHAEHWMRLADRLLAGSCHDLNGRSSALYGLAELARAGDDTEFVAEALSSEARRIQEVARALQLLLGTPVDRPEVHVLGDRMETLLSLFSVQPGAELVRIEVAMDPGTPAVCVPSRSACQAILLALNVVSANTLSGGSPAILRISLGPDQGRVFLQVEGALASEAGRLDPAAQELVDTFRTWPEELTSAISAMGGSSSFHPESQNVGAGPRAEIRLPTAS